MRGSLVPANAKRAMLIANRFRKVDVGILGVGFSITIILLMILGNSTTSLLLVACIPMIVSVILVLPIPNYHNTLVAIQSIIRFYNERRTYIWKGWCVYDEFKDDK